MLPSRTVYYSLVALAIAVGGYALWLRTSLGRATRNMQSATEKWDEEHRAALAHEARAKLLEEQRKTILAEKAEADRVSAYWKAQANRPVPVPDVPASATQVAALWRGTGFPSALEVAPEGTQLALSDSRKALALVIQAPQLSERLQGALHAVSSTEGQLRIERDISASYQASAIEFEGAFRDEARGAVELRVANAAQADKLKFEKRWGNLKIGGAVVITALITWKLSK